MAALSRPSACLCAVVLSIVFPKLQVKVKAIVFVRMLLPEKKRVSHSEGRGERKNTGNILCQVKVNVRVLLMLNKFLTALVSEGLSWLTDT